tara:strand:+ start:19 stop:540 length:522 start_codon:yes stop_codon:yes gene_type:complete
MGFDISGVNPKMHKTDYPLLDKYRFENYKSWQERQDAMEANGEERKYWEQYNQQQEDNPGIYFRNNVWWWRPLWDFVCQNCDDILSEEDMERGCFNDHHEITEDKAIKIAAKLQSLLLDDTIDKYEESYEEKRKKLEESDDKKTAFMANYPFCKENIAKFAQFCEESGGFIIS